MIQGSFIDVELYEELDAMPDLSTSQGSSLKIDTSKLPVDAVEHDNHVSVWICRGNHGEVQAERLVDGRWVPGEESDARAAVVLARLSGAM